MTINLTELDNIRSKATFKTASNDCGILRDEDGIDIGAVDSSCDGECIAATHNAADVLIEIAIAALEWQTSPQLKAKLARTKLLKTLAKVSL